MLTQSKKQIKSYEDLEVYQESFELAMEVHKISLTFPKHELYELGSQLRRSSKSIPANIAEGWSKKHTAQYLESLNIAQAELRETKVHLKFAYRLKYIAKEKYIDLISRYNQVAKKLKKLEKNLMPFSLKPKTQTCGERSRTNPKPKECGFTLTEMLVTIFVLMILIFGVSGIYIYSIRAQRRTLQLNLVAQDVQFVMDVLSRGIREGKIDYNYYGGIISSPSSELALYNRENNEGAVYKKVGQQIGICSCDGSCLGLCVEEAAFNSLSTERLKITDLQFYINPNHEPFADVLPIQPIQPRVTISMKVEGAGAELVVQQTVPQRFFERR